MTAHQGVFSDSYLLSKVLEPVGVVELARCQGLCTAAREAVEGAIPALRQDWAGDSPQCEGLDLRALWADWGPDPDLWDSSLAVEVADGRTVMEVAATPSRSVARDEDEFTREANCDDGALLLAWIASRRGAERLLNRRNHRGDVPLHCAAAAGDSARAAILLRHPAVAVDVKNHYERTPLVEACYWDHTDAAAQLLAAGADLNAFAPNVHGHGDFPLLLAVRNDNRTLVEMLCRDPTLEKDQTSMIGCPDGLKASDFARSKPVRDLLAQDPPLHVPHVPLEEFYEANLYR